MYYFLYGISDNDGNFIDYDIKTDTIFIVNSPEEAVLFDNEDKASRFYNTLTKEDGKSLYAVSNLNVKLPIRIVEIKNIKDDMDGLMKEIMEFHYNTLVDKCLENRDYLTLERLFNTN